MAEITVDDIKKLRAITGSGILDCRTALEEAAGDSAKAQGILREKGLASAAKKATREAAEGVVESYIHNGNRVGVLLELNCETDFVARTDEFRTLAHDIAMHVAAMDPETVSSKDGADSETSLLDQPFVKDPSKTIQDLINDTIARIGENVQIRRFTRFALSEE
ncbi:MAG: translation elongation factor Ts [SAR202 cluster bacterium]|jgi:elongation factor Ts|nr:translation elongation factor Ts [SAR202 cluster bacterium]|tara:strand:- start:2135 stop:2626 length:492 start_codon:yes stop_codon:yes gene_type:complete